MNHQTDWAIERLLGKIQDFEESLRIAQDQLNSAKEELISLLEKHGVDSIETVIDEAPVKVTIVRPTQLKLDEFGIEQALSDAVWRSITKRVIDKKALEDAVVRGKVEPNIVSKNSKEVATKPYLRITR